MYNNDIKNVPFVCVCTTMPSIYLFKIFYDILAASMTQYYFQSNCFVFWYDNFYSEVILQYTEYLSMQLILVFATLDTGKITLRL